MPIDIANARRRTVASFRLPFARLILIRSPSEPDPADVFVGERRSALLSLMPARPPGDHDRQFEQSIDDFVFTSFINQKIRYVRLLLTADENEPIRSERLPGQAQDLPIKPVDIVSPLWHLHDKRLAIWELCKHHAEKST